LQSGGLVLENADLTNVSAHSDVWEKVVRKLRTGAMPPAGVRRPDAQTYDGLAGWIESELDRAAAAHPSPGRPLPHRMNRAEYANAIRDLLDLEIGDVASLLPPDDSAFGFDNIADALGFSPVLLERFVGAAERISALAVGDTGIAPGSETYVLRQDYSQDQHVEGQGLGTVGGTIVRHTFPVDAGEFRAARGTMSTRRADSNTPTRSNSRSTANACRHRIGGDGRRAGNRTTPGDSRAVAVRSHDAQLRSESR
jgi:hypothetical protein